MNDPSSQAIADRLVAGGILSQTTLRVDESYWTVRLGVPLEQCQAGLSELANRGLIRREKGWTCDECRWPNVPTDKRCAKCTSDRTTEAVTITLYFRDKVKQTRDALALFLAHGMNTTGPWQERLSWRFQLLYGYSVPVFSFKYGIDRMSPLTLAGQRHRARELGNAIRGAQEDLRNSGRSHRADCVAHSFGTLLLANVLTHPEFSDIELGRIILLGSLVPRDYDWLSLVKGNRVEAVLNHRAKLDVWVPRARWLFPATGASGTDGFLLQGSGLTEVLSEDLRHSDYFATERFGSIVSDVWKPFLSGDSEVVAHASPSPAAWFEAIATWWVGRILLIVMALIGAWGVVLILQ